MARLTLRIDIDDRASIGPGKVRLLETIEEKGSIRSAAVALSMSYRRAWLLIQDIEDAMGGPVLSTTAGGSGGGGAMLTRVGEQVVQLYRRIEGRAAKSAVGDLDKLGRMAKRRAAPKIVRRCSSMTAGRNRKTRG